MRTNLAARSSLALVQVIPHIHKMSQCLLIELSANILEVQVVLKNSAARHLQKEREIAPQFDDGCRMRRQGTADSLRRLRNQLCSLIGRERTEVQFVKDIKEE